MKMAISAELRRARRWIIFGTIAAELIEFRARSACPAAGFDGLETMVQVASIVFFLRRCGRRVHSSMYRSKADLRYLTRPPSLIQAGPIPRRRHRSKVGSEAPK